jgi:PKD repeat protein
MEVTPGAARSATTFNLGPVIAALGLYASLPIFYVDFGDGSGFGSSGNLKSLGSFPTSHIYVNPGTYTVTGYANMDGRTESTSATITITPAKEEPAAAKATQSWEATTTPAATAVVPVAAADRGGALSIGTAVSEIVERNSRTAARTESKAPQVNTTTGQTTLVNIPSLPAGSTVTARVKIGKTWTTLPATDVEDDGTLTLPALTFAKAGTYQVELSYGTGTTRYVTVKVKKG